MEISNTQYRDILLKYEQIRLKNQRILYERIDELIEKIPNFKETQDEIVRLSADRARYELSHPDADKNDEIIRDYISKKKNLIKRREGLLEENGYPSDYLAPIYACALCKDTGYVDNVPCKCFNRYKADMLYEKSNVKDVLEAENFNTFREDYFDDADIDKNLSVTPRQNIVNIKNFSLSYVKNFGSDCRDLIFYGPAGSGKTFMTHCIAKALLDEAHSVVCLTAAGLFDILEKSKFDRDGTYLHDERASYILKCELLIVDDLGTELSNSFTASQLHYLIEERHLGKRATIFSTNLSIQELRAMYGERIFSRITGYYKFYRFIGGDIRIKLAIS